MTVENSDKITVDEKDIEIHTKGEKPKKEDDRKRITLSDTSKRTIEKVSRLMEVDEKTGLDMLCSTIEQIGLLKDKQNIIDPGKFLINVINNSLTINQKENKSLATPYEVKANVRAEEIKYQEDIKTAGYAKRQLAKELTGDEKIKYLQNLADMDDINNPNKGIELAPPKHEFINGNIEIYYKKDENGYPVVIKEEWQKVFPCDKGYMISWESCKCDLRKSCDIKYAEEKALSQYKDETHKTLKEVGKKIGNIWKGE